ncbi:site-specific integrase [Clostridium sp. 1001283B150210_160208_E6]|uniref:tyrosine-type recombinase/integrase n=1 Tax=Clostridium sp. 1001283B150210_160208_E6 TaxID=2787129 RepID=UPI0018A97E52|nr:site-specific integrase [Clostridium sp. 1001283B150210_160208_E6]
MARKTNRLFSTTDEEIAQINPANIELRDDFLDYMETTDHSESSIITYRNNIDIFFVYVLKHCKNKDFVDIKKKDIMSWQGYMVKNGLSPARIRTIKSTISSMSNFIENVLDEEDKWEGFRNIINKIPAPVLTPVRKKTILKDEQCQELLDSLVEKGKYQHACAFALAWASGRRKSELLRIKRSYINDESLIYGSLYKTPEKIKTKGRGSKGKALNVYILKTKFKPYFDLWMEERERLGVPDDIDEIFVTNRKGEWKPAKISLLDSYAEHFGKRLNVDFYFHCLRHQFTTALSLANIPDSIIQDLIGWESSDMVKLYKDVEVDTQLEKYFSEDGIKQVESGSLSNL